MSHASVFQPPVSAWFPPGRSVAARALRPILIEKAKSNPPDLGPIATAAAKLEPKLRAAFDAAIASIKGKSKLSDLARAAESGDPERVVAALNLDAALTAAFAGEGVAAELDAVNETLAQTVAAGAYAAMREAPRTMQAALSFDLLNPESVKFLREYNFDLVRQISDGTREAIREAMVRSFERGIPPLDTAREIRNSIGLTGNQVRAVTNFQRALMEQTPTGIRELLSRGLRDRRFDSTLRQALEQEIVLSRDQIQRMTDRYYQRYLKYRSEMIARTETIRAANAGQHQLWEQSAERGLINRNAIGRKWVTAGDERTCPLCQALSGVVVRGLDSTFSSGGHTVQHPGLHPLCRCDVVLVFR